VLRSMYVCQSARRSGAATMLAERFWAGRAIAVALRLTLTTTPRTREPLRCMSDVASSHAARRELWISHQHEGGLGAPLHNDHAESRPPLTADHSVSALIPCSICAVQRDSSYGPLPFSDRSTVKGRMRPDQDWRIVGPASSTCSRVQAREWIGASGHTLQHLPDR